MPLPPTETFRKHPPGLPSGPSTVDRACGVAPCAGTCGGACWGRGNNNNLGLRAPRVDDCTRSLPTPPVDVGPELIHGRDERPVCMGRRRCRSATLQLHDNSLGVRGQLTKDLGVCQRRWIPAQRSTPFPGCGDDGSRNCWCVVHLYVAHVAYSAIDCTHGQGFFGARHNLKEGVSNVSHRLLI